MGQFDVKRAAPAVGSAGVCMAATRVRVDLRDIAREIEAVLLADRQMRIDMPGANVPPSLQARHMRRILGQLAIAS